MSLPDLLEELRRGQIRVWMEGDQLRCTAPTGALTPELRERLRLEKDALVRFLRSAEVLARQERAIVPIQPLGNRIPVFAVPGHNGNVFSFRFLAQELGVDQPFFGLQPPGVDGECEPLRDIDELARYFASRILAFRPEGPYVLAGHCAGGGTAFAVADQLVRRGADVACVALFGSPYPTWYGRVPQWREFVGREARWVRHHVQALSPLSYRERAAYVAAKLAERWRQFQTWRGGAGAAAQDPVLAQRAKIEQATLKALSRHTPRYFAGRIAFFSPSQAWLGLAYATRWQAAADEVDVYCGPDGCRNDVMLHEAEVPVFAEQLRNYLHRIAVKGTPGPTPAGLAAVLDPQG